MVARVRKRPGPPRDLFQRSGAEQQCATRSSRATSTSTCAERRTSRAAEPPNVERCGRPNRRTQADPIVMAYGEWESRAIATARRLLVAWTPSPTKRQGARTCDFSTPLGSRELGRQALAEPTSRAGKRLPFVRIGARLIPRRLLTSLRHQSCRSPSTQEEMTR